MLKQLLSGFAFVVMVAAVSMGDAAEAGLAPQTSNERGVKVTVTPQNLSQEARAWDFDVVLETHTQALDDDLAKSSVLMADKKPYTPLGWGGAPPGGHHRKGVLHFRAIAPRPAAVELQIRLAADPSPRSFKWRLK